MAEHLNFVLENDIVNEKVHDQLLTSARWPACVTYRMALVKHSASQQKLLSPSINRCVFWGAQNHKIKKQKNRQMDFENNSKNEVAITIKITIPNI